MDLVLSHKRFPNGNGGLEIGLQAANHSLLRCSILANMRTLATGKTARPPLPAQLNAAREHCSHPVSRTDTTAMLEIV